jgi:membrane protease YdiL (CAAX protease family)
MRPENNAGSVRNPYTGEHSLPLNRSVIIELIFFFAGIAAVVLLYLFLLSALPRFSSIAAFILAAGCLWLNVFFLRRSDATLLSIGIKSLSSSFKDCIKGIAGGIVLVFAWVLLVILFLSPELHIQFPNNWWSLLNLLLFYFFNNAGEELAYRAYAFLRIELFGGRLAAIIGTSTLFALLHIQGGLPWLNAIAGVFTTALLLGAIFARYKSVPLVLGFHYATNIGQDIFGLRKTPLSFVNLNYTNVLMPRGTLVLILVATINMVLAFLVLRKNVSGSKQT